MSVVKLQCPQCGSVELDTVERLLGVAGTKDGIARDTGTGHLLIDWVGETDVNWDASLTIGVVCRTCGFETVDEDGDWWVGLVGPAQNIVSITAADVEQVDAYRHSA